MNSELITDSQDEKIEIEFRIYGILTFILVPLYLYGALVSGSFFIFPIIGFLLEYFDNKFTRFVKKFILYIVIILFGMKIKEKDTKFFRFWWFFTIGHILSVMITFALIFTSFTIIPLLLVLIYWKRFLRFMINILFLPKSQYIWSKTKKERELIIQKYKLMSDKDKEYLLFDRPTKFTHIFAFILILASPVLIAFLMAPVGILVSITQNRTGELLGSIVNIEFALSFMGYGLIAIIPYLLLNIPIKGYKITQIVTTKISTFITKTVASTGLNAIPYFAGEYYLELESEVVDMSSTTGLFEIFKRGRLFSIIITPLAIMSIILSRIINQIDANAIQDSLTMKEFFLLFSNEVVKNPLIIFSLYIIIPIAISIILPLIWSLNDAEIKRSTWRHMNSDFKTEISNVEDFGTSIDRIFKIIIGISAITNLSSSISVLTGITNSAIAWLFTSVILISLGVMVIPGTLTMAYLYFASGDHVNGVNHIRYNLSKEDEIAVGTVSRDYSRLRKLSVPPYLDVIDGNSLIDDQIISEVSLEGGALEDGEQIYSSEISDDVSEERDNMNL